MTEFLTGHPYLCFAVYIVTLLFITIWAAMWKASKKTEEKPELSVPPSPAEIEKQQGESEVCLAELSIDEAILHCNEIRDKNDGSTCGKNHARLADWLEELKAWRVEHGTKLRQEREGTDA